MSPKSMSVNEGSEALPAHYKDIGSMWGLGT